MSARAMINIDEYDGEAKKPIPYLSIYKHGDGYPDWLGRRLVQFFTDAELGKGTSGHDKNASRLFNGTGCLAAQLVTYLKTALYKGEVTAGDVYIVPRNHGDGDWVAYTYIITVVPTAHPDYRPVTEEGRGDPLSDPYFKYCKGNVNLMVQDRTVPDGLRQPTMWFVDEFLEHIKKERESAEAN